MEHFYTLLIIGGSFVVIGCLRGIYVSGKGNTESNAVEDMKNKLRDDDKEATWTKDEGKGK